MVTPPVALAAYTSASIDDAPIMKTAMSSFHYSLVGFTLPFMFIYRPAQLLMAPLGENFYLHNVAIAVVDSVLGVIALAGAQVGYLRKQRDPPPGSTRRSRQSCYCLPISAAGLIGGGINLAGAVIQVIVFLRRTNVIDQQYSCSSTKT